MTKESVRKVIVNGKLVEMPINKDVKYLDFDFTSVDTLTQRHYLSKEPYKWKIISINTFGNVEEVSKNASTITLKTDTLGTIIKIEIS